LFRIFFKKVKDYVGVFPLDGATLWYKAKKIDSNFTSLVLFKVKFREPRGYELMISPLYRGLKQ